MDIRILLVAALLAPTFVAAQDGGSATPPATTAPATPGTGSSKSGERHADRKERRENIKERHERRRARRQRIKEHREKKDQQSSAGATK